MQDNASIMKITGLLNITFLLGLYARIRHFSDECLFFSILKSEAKKSPQSFDEAINFLVGRVDGYKRSRWIY